MVLENMKHDRSKGHVGTLYVLLVSECNREVLMVLGMHEIMAKEALAFNLQPRGPSLLSAPW
jgi:hypothetical protein